MKITVRNAFALIGVVWLASRLARLASHRCQIDRRHRARRQLVADLVARDGPLDPDEVASARHTFLQVDDETPPTNNKSRFPLRLKMVMRSLHYFWGWMVADPTIIGHARARKRPIHDKPTYDDVIRPRP